MSEYLLEQFSIMDVNRRVVSGCVARRAQWLSSTGTHIAATRVRQCKTADIWPGSYAARRMYDTPWSLNPARTSTVSSSQSCHMAAFGPNPTASSSDAPASAYLDWLVYKPAPETSPIPHQSSHSIHLTQTLLTQLNFSSSCPTPAANLSPTRLLLP